MESTTERRQRRKRPRDNDTKSRPVFPPSSRGEASPRRVFDARGGAEERDSHYGVEKAACEKTTVGEVSSAARRRRRGSVSRMARSDPPREVRRGGRGGDQQTQPYYGWRKRGGQEGEEVEEGD
ncbi:hypothetical protein KM043_018158 [Ampulex compressa]|nr:hypothetical protein KM043_018158 [Ampulex compressa]